MSELTEELLNVIVLSYMWELKFFYSGIRIYGTIFYFYS
jgi:hypothetical protein